MDDEYTDGFYLVGQSPLEVDEEEDEVRAEYLPSIEEALKLLGRDNRVSIAARKPVPTPSPSLPPDQAAYDITLMLALHSHPECKFKWSHLVVDLTPTPDAEIRDMAPAENIGESSEVEIKVDATLKFEITPLANVQLTPEVTRKHTTRFPTVSASGQGTKQAWWTFQAGRETAFRRAGSCGSSSARPPTRLSRLSSRSGWRSA